MSGSKSRPVTVAPQQAVQDYLNTLLHDATQTALAEEHAEQQVKPPQITTQPAQPLQAKIPATAKPAAEQKARVSSAEPAPSLDVKGKIEPEAAFDDWKDGRPGWAQKRFECLLFRVAGLTLAVPLIELGGVLVMEDELTPLFGQPEWFLGLLPSKTEGTVKVIDTARWVMPERYTEQAKESLKYVVMMANSEWGLGCHVVADAITLEPHQVNWRTERSKRPWLAGTVIDHMCAIMDVAALVKLLREQSQSRSHKNPAAASAAGRQS